MLTIRRKILLFIVAPVVVVLGASLANNQLELRDAAVRDTENRFESITDVVAQHLAAQLAEVTAVNQSIRVALTLQFHLGVEGYTPEALDDLLSRFVRGDNLTAAVVAAFEPYEFPGKSDYAPFVRLGKDREIERGDLATLYDFRGPDSDWYNEPKYLGEAYWSEPFKGTGGDDWVVAFVSPIVSQGNFVGVISVDVDLDALARDKRLLELSQYELMIVAPGGRFVLHPDPQFNLNTVQEVADVTGQPGLVDYIQEVAGNMGDIVRLPHFATGEQTLVATAEIPGPGWLLIHPAAGRQCHGRSTARAALGLARHRGDSGHYPDRRIAPGQPPDRPTDQAARFG